MMMDIQRRQNTYEQEQTTLVGISLWSIFCLEYLLQHEEDDFASGMGDAQERSRKTFYREFKKVNILNQNNE